MATAQTFDGILAVQAVVDSQPTPGWRDAISVDIILIKGYSAPVRVSTISIPLPSGCVAFDGNSWVDFADDGSLMVMVIGSADSSFSTAASHVNNMKPQLHRYKIADDGTYQLMWRSAETPFMGNPYAGGPHLPDGGIFVSRDGSWGAWGPIPFDMGTGQMTFPPITSFNDTFIGLTYDVFNAASVYEASAIANCLTRRPYPYLSQSGLRQAVTFDGTAVRSTTWDVPATTVVDGTTYYITSMDSFRFYQDSYLNVAQSIVSADDGASYMKFGYVDPETYQPGTFGPLVYTRGEGYTGFLNRLPGSGVAFSPSTSPFMPLKLGSDGYYTTSLGGTSPVIDSSISVAQHNGLGVQFNLDPIRSPHLGTNYSLYWADVDGNITPAGSGTFSNEPHEGSFAFRPILPTTQLTGVIDSTRRLFTAV